MKLNGSISKKERKILLIIALAAFIAAFISFGSFSVENYNKEAKEQQSDLLLEANDGLIFAVDAGPDDRPFHRFRLVFLTFFIFLSLFKAKRFLASTFFTLLSVFIFVSWFARTYRDIEFNQFYMAGTPLLLKIAAYYDYFVFLFVVVLLCWQLSIFTRFYLRNRQTSGK